MPHVLFSFEMALFTLDSFHHLTTFSTQVQVDSVIDSIFSPLLSLNHTHGYYGLERK